MKCGRCKIRPGEMIHARAKRKDGSERVSMYCRPCQRERMRKYLNKNDLVELRGYNPSKARQANRRLAEKYA